MIFNNVLMKTAKRIPSGLRKSIIAEELIDKAQNKATTNSPMEFLFDVYVEFIDPVGTGEWLCAKCRQKVIDDFRKLKPYLIELVNGTNGTTI